MLLISMKCIHVHDCLEGEKTFDNKKQVKVHFLVMHCDLNHCHDHKKSCGSYSTVIALCVERALDPSTPSWFC